MYEQPDQNLPDIQIISPCKQNWDEMTGSEQKRFCDACSLHVHDISKMSAQETTDLLSENTDEVCLRICRLPDGRIITDERTLWQRSCQKLVQWSTRLSLTVLAIISAVSPSIANGNCDDDSSSNVKHGVPKIETQLKFEVGRSIVYERSPRETVINNWPRPLAQYGEHVEDLPLVGSDKVLSDVMKAYPKKLPSQSGLIDHIGQKSDSKRVLALYLKPRLFHADACLEHARGNIVAAWEDCNIAEKSYQACFSGLPKEAMRDRLNSQISEDNLHFGLLRQQVNIKHSAYEEAHAKRQP